MPDISVMLAAVAGWAGGHLADKAMEEIASGPVGELLQRAQVRVRAYAGTVPANHELEHVIRFSELTASLVLVSERRRALVADERYWQGDPLSDFVRNGEEWLLGQIGLCRSLRTVPDQRITGEINAALDPALAASDRLDADLALAQAAEEVWQQLVVGAGVPAPEAFADRFLGREKNKPGWSALFVAFIREQLKERPAVQVAFVVSRLARVAAAMRRLEGLAASIKDETSATHRTVAHIARRQEEESAAAPQRHSEVLRGLQDLKRLIVVNAGPGAEAVKAMQGMREVLRSANVDVDRVDDEHLPGIVRRVLEQVQTPAAVAQDFEGAVRRVLTEAQNRVRELAFGEAAHVLDAQLAQMESEDQDRSRGRAALLAERGRVATLQLQYRQAAAFHEAAADAVSFDDQAAWGHLLAAASALSDLGRDFGDNQAYLDAIQLYRNSALPLAPRKERPLDWAATQNDLGNALQAFGERESGTEKLEEAIDAYRSALDESKRDREPLRWAALQNNLGVVLRIIGARERGTARLEEAVIACQHALLERLRNRVPLEWAMTQVNLGDALWTLGTRETETTRLEEAVASYRAALEEYTRDQTPFDWATAQTSLGLALEKLGGRESGTTRLEQAVEAHRAALKVWTRQRVPARWAVAQSNLSIALQVLGERESGTIRLEEAVAACRDALGEQTRERTPRDWALSHNTLGCALAILGTREGGTARLEEAIMSFNATLEVWTREQAPLDWARGQQNLGNALRTVGARQTGRARTSRLMQAIAAYRNALLEHTLDREPFLWASTQNNLGIALMSVGQEVGRASLEEAVAAFCSALQIFKRDQTSASWATTQNNLGNVLLQLGTREDGPARLEEAIAALAMR